MRSSRAGVERNSLTRVMRAIALTIGWIWGNLKVSVTECYKEVAAGHNAVNRISMGGSQATRQEGTLMSDLLRYHHVGIPTKIPREGEVYLDRFKMYTSGFETSQFGVEWLRFDEDAPFPELVKTVPHIAFVVDDLDAAIAGREVLIQPNSPTTGVTVAFIVDNGAPVEFLQFDSPEFEVRPGAAAERSGER